MEKYQNLSCTAPGAAIILICGQRDEMRRTLLCGFLLLWVQVCLVKAGNTSDRSSHNLQSQESSTKKIPVEIVATKMKVSPTWYLSEGDTVEINCTTFDDKGNHSHKVDLQLVWTKLGPGEKTKTVLVRQRASTGISFVLGPVTHEHQGVYTCDDDGSLPAVYVNDWHHMIWVADASPRASIDVISHNRIQFLHDEQFTLSCQLPDNDSQWKMMRFNQWWGTITECPNQESSDGRLSCTTTSEYPWSDVLYWCESSSGNRSNALNITTTVGVNVTLESPTRPVMEGDDVMLRCLLRNTTTNTFTSNFRAVFYKNNRRIRIQTEGNMILKAVTKADEGMYTCRHPVEGSSHYSWISIRGSKLPKNRPHSLH